MEILIVFVVPFIVGYILGKTMPQVSGLAWGVLAGIILGYLLVYDNVYLWASMNYSGQVVNQTRVVMTLFVGIGIALVTAFGVRVGKGSKK